MKYDYESILSVLALFDKEDIPYIKSNILLNINNYEDNNKINKPKIKKLGGNNDRNRKWYLMEWIFLKTISNKLDRINIILKILE